MSGISLSISVQFSDSVQNELLAGAIPYSPAKPPWEHGGGGLARLCAN